MEVDRKGLNLNASITLLVRIQVKESRGLSNQIAVIHKFGI